MHIEGDIINETGCQMTEEGEFWKWDLLELIQELLENLEFKEEMQYKPMKLFLDSESGKHIYNEMWTGNWWFNKAVS